jgi:undecaprenyl diphosphate synthase
MNRPIEQEPRVHSEESLLAERLDRTRMPRHVAIIMDGNGRWAGEKNLPRVKGHEAGMRTVREIIECAAELRLEVLTLYAFSVENWKRPKEEILALMLILKYYIHKEGDNLMRNNIRFQPIGRYRELDASIVEELEKLKKRTAGNTGTLVNAALNYGGRAEIVDACKAIARRALAHEINPDDLGEDDVADALYTVGLPDPDLLIRTGGELRVSNFLLWQIAYAELWTTRTYWPDFSRKDFVQALLDFQGRDRRYGGVK